MPKINVASSMIVEDHLKRCLAKTSNKPFKTSNNKLLPKAQHSPFGDFPKDYLPNKKSLCTAVEPIDKHEQSLAASGTAILKKGQGLGGKSTSLNKPKDRPQP
jgi:hypothetical protein